MESGSGAGQAHDATVAVGDFDVAAAREAEAAAFQRTLDFSRDEVDRMRRKLDKANEEVVAATAALAASEARLAALGG